MIKIAVDAMGGDYGLNTTVKAAMDAVKKFDDIEIVLYGDEVKINELLTCKERITIHPTEDVLDMGEEDPIRAVRSKRNTASLCVAMQDAKNKLVDAVVTSGPTQCVVVGAHILIRRLPEVERIALCPIIPSIDGRAKLLLDVGANVELRPEHIDLLATFATIVAKEVLGYENPRVGLLNIGSEPGKGRPVDKETFEVLSANKNINFYGNVEGNDVITTPIEIIINDGFTTNVCMKAIEGTAKAMGVMLKEEIKRNIWGKIGYIFMRKNLARFKKRMDSSEVGGAMILGIPVPVIKAHGNSDSFAFYNAIRQAREMVKKDVINHVRKAIEKEAE